jgi:ABC-type polysaccharide/polyol phosphate transport system ATPase subunit
VIAPGEIVLENAWRTFATGGGRTLKEVFTRRAAHRDEVQALAGVNLRIAPGETVGIVGRNGAGKTSTLRVLGGIVPLTRGRAECGGRVAALIELGAGFGREFTGRENIVLNGALNGMGKDEIAARMDDIVAFSELGHFVDVPVKGYSSGMLLRLGFAIAAHLDSDVMLIDEVLAVGDLAFQRKCLAAIRQRIDAGATLVLVSHAPTAIERMCERVVVLDAGQVVFDGPTTEGLLHYQRMLQTTTAHAGHHRTVVVEDVELRDASGARRTTFSSGETLKVVLRLAARSPARPCRVEIELRQSNGTPVFGTSKALDEPPAGLTFEIAQLNLLGGDYDLAIGVREPGDLEPGVDRMVGLSVAETPGATGAVDLRGTWTHESAVRA